MGLIDATKNPATSGNPQSQAKLDQNQQQQVDLAVKQAVDFIFSKENANALADAAESSDPVTAIVDTATQVLKGIYEAARQAGHELTVEIVAVIGFNIAHIFASVLSLADIIKPEEVESVAKQAYDVAIQNHNAAGQQAPQQPT